MHRITHTKLFYIFNDTRTDFTKFFLYLNSFKKIQNINGCDRIIENGTDPELPTAGTNPGWRLAFWYGTSPNGHAKYFRFIYRLFSPKWSITNEGLKAWVVNDTRPKIDAKLGICAV